MLDCQIRDGPVVRHVKITPLLTLLETPGPEPDQNGAVTGRPEKIAGDWQFKARAGKNRNHEVTAGRETKKIHATTV